MSEENQEQPKTEEKKQETPAPVKTETSPEMPKEVPIKQTEKPKRLPLSERVGQKLTKTGKVRKQRKPMTEEQRKKKAEQLKGARAGKKAKKAKEEEEAKAKQAEKEKKAADRESALLARISKLEEFNTNMVSAQKRRLERLKKANKGGAPKKTAPTQIKATPEEKREVKKPVQSRRRMVRGKKGYW